MKSFVPFIQEFRQRMADGFMTEIDDCRVGQVGRDELEYREGERRMRFQADLLYGHPAGAQRAIYPSTISAWLPPYQDDAVTVEDRERILIRVGQYFEMQDIKYVMQ